jgi:hypothetical protein
VGRKKAVAEKKRELTQMQKDFLDALLGEAEGNFREAMRIAGYSDNVRVAEVVRTLKNEIIEKAKEAMAMSSVEAAFALMDGMRNPNALGMKNKLTAAEKVLDRAGIIKKDEDGKGDTTNNYIVLLPEKKNG